MGKPMEYITVLKKPDFDLNIVEQGGVHAEKSRNNNRILQATGRLCSQALFSLVVFVLMFVLFASQLIVHVQLQELREKVNVNTEKTDDMLEAALLEKFLSRQRNDADRKRNNRNKMTRRDTGNPVYFLLRGGGTATGMGVFRWDITHNESTLSADVYPRPSASQTEQVEIGVSGIYLLSVQINVKGRSRMGSIFTPVGYWICKNSPNTRNLRIETRIDKVFTTQDRRGQIIYTRGGHSADPPVDSITYSNLVYLRQNDRIFIKKPEETRTDNHIQYDNSANSAHFSGMLLLRDN